MVYPCLACALPARRSHLRRSALPGRSGGAALRAAFGGGQRFALPWAPSAPQLGSTLSGLGSEVCGLGFEVWGQQGFMEGWASRFQGQSHEPQFQNCEAQSPNPEAQSQNPEAQAQIPQMGPKGTLWGDLCLGYEVFAGPGRKGGWASRFEGCPPRFCSGGSARGSSGGG